MRALGVRRSPCFSIYLGDLPLANNTPISSGNIQYDNFLTSVSAIYNIQSASCHYVRVNVSHIFAHDKFKLFVTIFGTKTNPAQYTNDNDGFISPGPWIEN